MALFFDSGSRNSRIKHRFPAMPLQPGASLGPYEIRAPSARADDFKMKQVAR